MGARLTLAIFIVFQVADGLITYTAVDIFGFGAEGNPLLRSWILLAGPGLALFGAKAIACGCSWVLFMAGRHKALAAVSILYLFGAVVPWLIHLSA